MSTITQALAPLRALVASLTAPSLPTRVAILDSGELVLMTPDGRSQVLSHETTMRVAQALEYHGGLRALRDLRAGYLHGLAVQGDDVAQDARP